MDSAQLEENNSNCQSKRGQKNEEDDFRTQAAAAFFQFVL